MSRRGLLAAAMMGAALAVGGGGGGYSMPLFERTLRLKREKYPGQHTAYLKGASRGGAEGKVLPFIPDKAK
jgi:hypothetical protein